MMLKKSLAFFTALTLAFATVIVKKITQVIALLLTM